MFVRGGGEWRTVDQEETIFGLFFCSAFFTFTCAMQQRLPGCVVPRLTTYIVGSLARTAPWQSVKSIARNHIDAQGTPLIPDTLLDKVKSYQQIFLSMNDGELSLQEKAVDLGDLELLNYELVTLFPPEQVVLDRALLRAVKESKVSFVRFLLACGAWEDGQESARTGETLLHQAAQTTSDIVQLCIESARRRGVDMNSFLNAPNVGRQRPLHYAAQKDDDRLAASLVHVLCAAGAHVDVEAAVLNETPLGYAARAGKEATAEALLVYGANPSKPDSQGCTPLGWARRNGHVAVEQLLLAHVRNLVSSMES
jgi:hypothetical protein